MAMTCKFEHCQAPATMGTKRIDFTAHSTQHLWYADIPMCDECYEIVLANANTEGADINPMHIHWEAAGKLPPSKHYRSPANIQLISFKH